METYTDTEDEEMKAASLNLITHVEVERACQSDAKSLIPAIDSTKARGLSPKRSWPIPSMEAMTIMKMPKRWE